jgi:monoamine oxidase
MLAAASFLAVATALPSQYSDLKLEEYNFTEVISRYVCIVGGGSSGTYAAIRLRDLGKNVVVVEHKDRLGGHTQTYTDPQTGRTVDFGVQAFHNLEIVKNYFKRFSIPLVTTNFSSPGVTSKYVDFSTGKEVAGYVPSDPRAALAGYVAQLAK